MIFTLDLRTSYNGLAEGEVANTALIRAWLEQQGLRVSSVVAEDDYTPWLVTVDAVLDAAYYFPFEGTTVGFDKAGAFIPVNVGAIRFRPGMHPGEQAVFLEELTTNLLTNPSAEASLNFLAGISSATVTRVARPQSWRDAGVGAGSPRW